MEEQQRRRYKPKIYTNIDSLQNNRNAYMNHLSTIQAPKMDLNKTLNDMQTYQQFYAEHPFPKKAKKEKFGVEGMSQLAQIVLDMNKDIKQIKEAQSLAGAQEWVNKHGSERYVANERDINGDSIPDIVVQRKDENGNPIANDYVIVNGYTTAESTYPYRHAYYTQFPTRDDRKQARLDGENYHQFINGMYNPQYGPDHMTITSYANQAGQTFAAKVKKAGYSKIIEPHNKTPYQLFTSYVIKPIWDVFKLNYGNALSATLLTKIAANIWNQAIVVPAMFYVYGDQVQNVDDVQWKKLRNKKEVKEAVKRIVLPYLNSVKLTFDFLPAFVDLLGQNGIQVPEYAAGIVEIQLKARLLNMQAPANEQAAAIIEQEWKNRIASEL